MPTADQSRVNHLGVKGPLLELKRINPREPKLGYESIKVLGFFVATDPEKISKDRHGTIYALDNVATLMCNVVTDVAWRNTLAWQDIVNAVEHGNYEVISGGWK